MKNIFILPVLIAAVIYVAMYPLASATGLIHPLCYACAGTVVPLLFAFVYLTAAANMQCFGAAAVLGMLLAEKVLKKQAALLELKGVA